MRLLGGSEGGLMMIFLTIDFSDIIYIVISSSMMSIFFIFSKVELVTFSIFESCVGMLGGGGSCFVILIIPFGGKVDSFSFFIVLYLFLFPISIICCSWIYY